MDRTSQNLDGIMTVVRTIIADPETRQAFQNDAELTLKEVGVTFINGSKSIKGVVSVLQDFIDKEINKKGLEDLKYPIRTFPEFRSIDPPFTISPYIHPPYPIVNTPIVEPIEPIQYPRQFPEQFPAPQNITHVVNKIQSIVSQYDEATEGKFKWDIELDFGKIRLEKKILETEERAIMIEVAQYQDRMKLKDPYK